MAIIADNINLLPNLYKEDENIIILRVTEKEETLTEIIQIKVQLNRERGKRSNKYTDFLKSHPT